MYCKQCGKEISDDSKYCQHCGGFQEENSGILKLSTKGKKWLWFYGIWFVTNLIMFFWGKKLDCDHDWTFPLVDVQYDYDITELLLYAVLIPLVIYGITNLFKKKKSNY